jgi:hypothetical protein
MSRNPSSSSSYSSSSSSSSSSQFSSFLQSTQPALHPVSSSTAAAFTDDLGETRSLAVVVPAMLPSNTSTASINFSNLTQGPLSAAAATLSYETYQQQTVYRSHAGGVEADEYSAYGVHTNSSGKGYGVYGETQLYHPPKHAAGHEFEESLTSHLSSLSLNKQQSQPLPFTPSVSDATLSSSFSAIDSKADFPAVPEEPKGGYLEPMCHFGSNTAPQEIVGKLTTIFDELAVDFHVVKPKYKIQAISYAGQHRHGPSCRFVVRVFSWPKEDGEKDEEEETEEFGNQKVKKAKFAIEFQRRDGDIFHFYELFQAAKESFCPSSISSSTAQHTLRKTCLSAPPPLPALSVNEEQVTQGVKCLQQMCASECIDVKVQAILALADLTFQEDAKISSVIASDASVFQTFLSCAASTSEDVSRGALSALANLVKKHMAVAKALAGNDGALTLLEKAAGSSTLEMLRETGRTVENLIEKLPELGRHIIMQRTVEKLALAPIQSVRSLAMKIQMAAAH